MRENDHYTPDELRNTAANLRELADNIATTPPARHAFTVTADLIEKVAAGTVQPIEAEVAMRLIDPMLDAEGARRVRQIELNGELAAGLTAEDAPRIRRAMAEMLHLLSDEQVLNIATVLDMSGLYEMDADGLAVEMPLVHQEPAGVM